MQKLLIEYMATLNNTKKMLKECDDPTKIKIINSVINELEFVIKWLKTGHNPNDYKAIDKRTVYLVDPHTIEAVIEVNHYLKVSTGEYMDYIDREENLIHKVLNKLSKRELEVFLMVKCEGLSLEDAGTLIGVKKGSIQKYIERANAKVDGYILSEKMKLLISKLKLNVTNFIEILTENNIQITNKAIKVEDDNYLLCEVLNYVLNQLNKNERMTFIQYHINNKTIIELQEILSISYQSCVNNINKATKKLEVILSSSNEVLISQYIGGLIHD